MAPDLVNKRPGTGYSQLYNLCGFLAVLRIRNLSKSALAPTVGPDSYHDGCGSGFDEGVFWDRLLTTSQSVRNSSCVANP